MTLNDYYTGYIDEIDDKNKEKEKIVWNNKKITKYFNIAFNNFKMSDAEL